MWDYPTLTAPRGGRGALARPPSRARKCFWRDCPREPMKHMQAIYDKETASQRLECEKFTANLEVRNEVNPREEEPKRHENGSENKLRTLPD
jgi:hypothetical protein